MVQGQQTGAIKKDNSWDTTSKKSGFDALQKREQQKKEAEKKAQKDQYGAWGPVFKNKETFASMHFC